MISNESLELIAKSPRAFLRQGNRLEEQIRVKERRVKHLQQISVQITTTIKAVSAYTGPNDKIGNCVVEMLALAGEIETQIAELLRLQKEIAEAIEELVPDKKQRSLMEAKYLAGMTWEQIAYEFHYAYRWVMRLHKQALAAMQEGAVKCLSTDRD